MERHGETRLISKAVKRVRHLPGNRIEFKQVMHSKINIFVD